MGKIKELLIKYKEPVLYVVFGVLTTVVSYASYWIFTDFLHIPYMVSTALSWVLSVTFAYVTNRKWVFESRAHGSQILRCSAWMPAITTAVPLLGAATPLW